MSESTMGVTGVLVHGGLSQVSTTAGKVLHALHLDAWGRQSMRSMRLRIQLDDAPQTEEWYFATHFVPCAPGSHRLELASNEANMSPLWIHGHATIDVEPGQVTHVMVIPSMPGHLTVSVLGTWPRVVPATGAEVEVPGLEGKLLARLVREVEGHTLVQFPDTHERWYADALVKRV